MKDFRNLKVWEKGHKMTLSIYSLTQIFPKEESYGLTSQIKRASSSIPTNIAEGWAVTPIFPDFYKCLLVLLMKLSFCCFCALN